LAECGLFKGLQRIQTKKFARLSARLLGCAPNPRGLAFLQAAFRLDHRWLPPAFDHVFSAAQPPFRFAFSRSTLSPPEARNGLESLRSLDVLTIIDLNAENNNILLTI
jgi:hypothetical protein